jgi:glycosyltransferase involved in cell wall biosynthesis
LNTDGEFIAFLDDDDEWLPEKLMSQVKILENNGSRVGLVYSGFFVIDNTTRKVLGQKIPSKKGSIYDDLLKCNVIGTPSTVILRRECLRKVGLFDENIACGLDHDLWIRISKHYNVEYVDEPLVRYHIHKNRLSTNPEVRARGIKDMMDKYGKRIISENDYYRNSCMTIGMEFCDEGNMTKGRKALLTAIRFNPLKINPFFYFGISLLDHKNYLRLRNLKEKTMGRIRANLSPMLGPFGKNQ